MKRYQPDSQKRTTGELGTGLKLLRKQMLMRKYLQLSLATRTGDKATSKRRAIHQLMKARRKRRRARFHSTRRKQRSKIRVNNLTLNNGLLKALARRNQLQSKRNRCRNRFQWDKNLHSPVHLVISLVGNRSPRKINRIPNQKNDRTTKSQVDRANSLRSKLSLQKR